MKVGKYIASFLNADDVRDKPRLATIANVIEEKVGTDDKLVVYAEEFDQGIVMNKGNIQNVVELLGSDESEDWIGQKLIVWCDPSVKFQGKKVGGIAFRKYDENSRMTRDALANLVSSKRSETSFPE